MAVTPIIPLEALEPLSQDPKRILSTTPDASSLFGDVLKQAMQNVNQTDTAVKQDEMKIATGQSDDLHTFAINSTKAEIALDAFVEVRNKALDAYKEIMQMAL